MKRSATTTIRNDLFYFMTGSIHSITAVECPFLIVVDSPTRQVLLLVRLLVVRIIISWPRWKHRGVRSDISGGHIHVRVRKRV